MSSRPESEIIHIVFTYDEVYDIAEQLNIDGVKAIERALDWAPHIEEYAIGLIYDQLYSVVEHDTP